MDAQAPPKNLRIGLSRLRVTDEDTEAQRGAVTCPGSHSHEVVERLAIKIAELNLSLTTAEARFNSYERAFASACNQYPAREQMVFYYVFHARYPLSQAMSYVSNHWHNDQLVVEVDKFTKDFLKSVGEYEEEATWIQ